MSAFTRALRAVAAVAAGAVLFSGTAVATPVGQTGTAGVEVGEATLRLAAAPGQVADVANSSMDNGAPVVQWGLTGGPNQRWQMESSLDGYYRFKATHSDKCLNVQGASTADGAPVIQYTCGAAANELWKPVRRVTGYQFVSKNSGKCLNVRGGLGQGNPLVQYTCSASGAPNDVWLVVWAVPLAA